MTDQGNLSLSEAVTVFLGSLVPEQSQDAQPELIKFIRWFGGERPIVELTALDVEKYGNSFSSSLSEPEKTIGPVRNFLAFAKKKKIITVSLSSHLRINKAKKGRLAKRSVEVEQVTLTAEGHKMHTEDLDRLKGQRPQIAEQIKLAAADKDVRENAPLEAARERQGQVEARIREIEAILKRATIVDSLNKTSWGVGIGCIVKLCDVDSGEELCYTLVSPSEANPLAGKISIASPTGKALLEQEIGAIIDVIAPVGTLRYRIDDIKG